MEQLSVFMKKHQPLTPLSPSLPTSLPHVCEPIPQLPLTPPDGEEEYIDTAANEEAIRTALHVLATERDALTHLGSLYESNPVAQEGFVNAVNIILKTVIRCGKLVVCGVGKSGKIGQKVVATMNSFGIRSTFLHPTEALHGDLGMIGAVSRHSPHFLSAPHLLTKSPERRGASDHLFWSHTRTLATPPSPIFVTPAHCGYLPYSSFHLSALLLPPLSSLHPPPCSYPNL